MSFSLDTVSYPTAAVLGAVMSASVALVRGVSSTTVLLGAVAAAAGACAGLAFVRWFRALPSGQ